MVLVPHIPTGCPLAAAGSPPAPAPGEHGCAGRAFGTGTCPSGAFQMLLASQDPGPARSPLTRSVPPPHSGTALGATGTAEHRFHPGGLPAGCRGATELRRGVKRVMQARGRAPLGSRVAAGVT